MTLYQNRYRIESTRLRGWDYSAPGYYFVTVCTCKRNCFFGKIANGNMHLNEFGKIVYDEWMKSFTIRRELVCDEFVVMPNHFHGIVNIGDGGEGVVVETPWHGVSTVSTQQTKSGTLNQGRRWKPGVLGSIIGRFKMQVTKQIRCKGNAEFAWQPRFHDHIIRNDQELHRIRQYIRNNPVQWDHDRFNDGMINVVRECDSEYGWERWMV